MKKYILILLLFTGFLQAQTYPVNPTPFGKIALKTNGVSTSTTKINTQESDGQINYIDAVNLPIPISVLNVIKQKADLSTGLIKNGLISINADPTKFNVSAGVGIISNFSDPDNPVSTIINFPAFTGITPTYLTTGNITYIAVNSTPAIVMQATTFTAVQRRDLIVLGAVIHSNLTNINVVNNIDAPSNAVGNQLHDFIEAVGALNITGNKYSANGANLSLNKSAGSIFKFGVNFSNDWKNPHQISQSSGTALTFRYRTQNGTEGSDVTVLNPAVYDVANVLTAVPNNKFTIQTVTMFQTGLTRIQYGQNVYDDMATALAAISTRDFNVESNIKENGITRAYIILKNNATSLLNLSDTKIVEAQKFGGVASGGVALTFANIVSALGYTPENTSNKQNSLAIDGTGIKFPTVDALNGGLLLKENAANKATDFSIVNNILFPTVQATKAYVDGRILSFNSETIDYLNRMTAASDPMDYASAIAFDDFITECKRLGIITLGSNKIKLFTPLWGNTLSGAFVKFFAGAEGYTPLVSNGSTGTLTYDKTAGLVLSGATDRYIETNFVPDNNSLDLNNIAFGIYVPDYSIASSSTNGLLVGDVVGSANSKLTIGYTGSLGVGAVTQALQAGGRRQQLVNFPSSGYFSAFLNGGNQTNSLSFAIPSGTVTGNINFFRGTTSAVTRYMNNAKLSYFIMTSGLTDTQGKGLNNALFLLYKRLGRISTTGSITAFFGNSNTAGQGITNPGDRFSVLVSAATGAIEKNMGMPSSALRTTPSNGIISGYQRYTDLLAEQINTIVIVYGTNDMNADGNVNGDPTLIADYQTKMETIIQAFKDKGVRVVVGSIPYATAPSSTKSLAWRNGAKTATKNKNVPYVDLWNLFADTASPTSYLSDGTLHYNASGHALIAQKLISAFNGIVYRQPLLDFPSIAAGGTENIDVIIENITVSNSVSSINAPELRALGLRIDASVVSDDTVRVSVYNPTGSAIDPSAYRHMIKVLIN